MTEQRLIVTVSQAELEAVCGLRRDVTWKRSELAKLEGNLITLLLNGADIEQGAFKAKVKFSARHTLSWKRLVVEGLGKDYAEEQWKASRIVKVPRLEVIEHPPLELWKAAS